MSIRIAAKQNTENRPESPCSSPLKFAHQCLSAHQGAAVDTNSIKLELENEARAKFACGRSTWHTWQKLGLVPPAVKIGPRAIRYPANEINAVVAYRVAGKSDDEIKALVIRLVEERQVAA